MDEMTTQLDEALALALKLSPKQRIRLIERLASSLEPEIEAPPKGEEQLPRSEPVPKTGAEMVAMLELMEPIEFVDPEIDDPVEWVKAQRQKEADRLKPYWNGEK